MLSIDESAELVAIDQEKHRRRARHSFHDFVTYGRKDYHTSEFSRVLSHHLDLALQRKIRRLIVCGPPQHGKSELVSRQFPAYALGENPEEKIIGASYAASLANEMCRHSAQVMDSEPYREVFETRIPSLAKIDGRNLPKGAARRTSSVYDVIGHTGNYRAAGVGVGITGRPCTIGIIDDPFKDNKEAASALIRQNVWNWYETAFRTRIAENGIIIITMTRWHEDDLVGRLLDLMRKDPKADQWTVLNFEAIKETPVEKDFIQGVKNTAAEFDTRKLGEALVPQRFSKKTLETTKASVGPSFWVGMFQGRPVTGGGAIIKRSWIKFYRKTELPTKFDRKVTSWDLRFKEGSEDGDYVAGQAWARKGSQFFLLGPREVYDRLSFQESIDEVKNFAYLNHRDAHQHLVENKANGPALVNTLKKKISRLLLVEPQGGKEERLKATEGLWAAGNVLLPHPDDVGPWILEWVEDIVGFPKRPHDDRVDAASQALVYLDSGGSRIKSLIKM